MFKGDYLRVQTPITSDGVLPVVENERIKYREDHLPLTAKKMLEQKNQRLPAGLRKRIEVVSSTVKPVIKTSPKPAPVVNIEPDEEDIAEEDVESGESEPAQGQPQTPAPKKRGPKPKK